MSQRIRLFSQRPPRARLAVGFLKGRKGELLAGSVFGEHRLEMWRVGTEDWACAGVSHLGGWEARARHQSLAW